MCGAVLLFACLDAMAKWLGGHLHPFQVTGMRYISAFFIALIFLNPFTRPNILKTTQPRMQFFRGLLMLGTTLLNFLSFRYLQLDEALAIMFSTPFTSCSITAATASAPTRSMPTASAPAC